uniref:Uncharacterized protein n=1 Tax=Oryza glumipatula TaxID=40148 RepID=A0A0D9ZHI5_9ORYZ
MRRSIGYGGGSARRANGGLVMRSDDEDGHDDSVKSTVECQHEVQQREILMHGCALAMRNPPALLQRHTYLHVNQFTVRPRCLPYKAMHHLSSSNSSSGTRGTILQQKETKDRVRLKSSPQVQ